RARPYFLGTIPAIRDAVGELLLQYAKHDEAVAVLRQAMSLAPDENGIREHYGMALFYAKQYREAVSVLERLVNDESGKTARSTGGADTPVRQSYANRADIRTALGECQMQIDQPREARDNFEL